MAFQTSYIVKDIQVECSDFAVVRKHFYNANITRDPFKNIYIDNILSLLKEMKSYQIELCKIFRIQ